MVADNPRQLEAVTFTIAMNSLQLSSSTMLVDIVGRRDPEPLGSAAVEPSAWVAKAVDWGRCSDPVLRQLGGRCGFVAVPLDYSRPRGTKSGSRCRAFGARRRGTRA
jgi:hypothetical protein